MFSVIDVHEAADEKLYVEDVFSAFTYTGNGSTQSIVNGIDLAGKGGFTWFKGRSGATDHGFYDTARGATKDLVSNATSAETTQSTGLTAFNADGFSLGSLAKLNTSTATYIGWTFRKAKKFFDVKTYTGNGVAGRQIAHDLGVAPGMIVVKPYSASGSWSVYHRSAPSNPTNLFLDTTAAGGPNQFSFGDGISLIHPSDTVFTLGQNNNNSGDQYVAYIFAHDDSADGIIQCGTFTSSTTVNLGWEPQYVLLKRVESPGSWLIFDTARGWDLSTSDKYLLAEASAAEASIDFGNPTATGFSASVQSGAVYVYLAIRKGLMRPPTDASKVFDIVARTGTSAAATITTPGIKTGVDLAISKRRNSAVLHSWQDRLRGSGVYLTSNSTAADDTTTEAVTSFNMSSVAVGVSPQVNVSPHTYINYFFKHARGFFDIVGYTGTGAARTVPHNLGAVPELMIVKRRDGAVNWDVFHGNSANSMQLNLTAASAAASTVWSNTAPTSSVFTVGTSSTVNASSAAQIAYLFASCPGVSKIDTYTGTGAAQNINCGFAAGARFVMIKRIDGVSNWTYWDTARGIVSGTEPYLRFNITGAEATSPSLIDPFVGGFTVAASGDGNTDVTGGVFLYLAIA